MNKKILSISYIFTNPEEVESRNIYSLINGINITDNLLLNYFRVSVTTLDLDPIKNIDHNLYSDNNRNDNIYIYFQSVGTSGEISRLLESNQIDFPGELFVFSLNCSYEQYINDLVRNSVSKNIKEHNLNLSIGIYEDVITIRFNREFYYDNAKKLEDTLLQWENSLGDVKYRKTLNFS